MIDYRKLRLSNFNAPPFRHLWLLLFWPVYGILFAMLESNVFHQVYTPVQCALDDRIPFCEWFLIPYLFWFLFLFGMHVYLLLFDIPAFRRFMRFVCLTYGATLVIYLLYPTCQELRPGEFARDNALTRLTAWFYAFDTSTNVCPSLHVVGSLAVALAALDTPRFRTPLWQIFFLGTTLLICLSTLFLKQHSVVDVFWGLALSILAALAVYVLPKAFRRSFAGRDHDPAAEFPETFR